jgi:hypothetical protein
MNWSRDSSASITKCYCLDRRVLYLATARKFCVHLSFHAGSWAHSASFPVGSGDTFPDYKVSRA